MFSLGVSPQSIQDVLFQLKDVIYPNSIKLVELTRIVFGTSTEIQQRKVRLAIEHLRKLGFLIIGERGYSMAGDDPAPVIEFINKMYSRANNITKSTDIMFHALKQKYGDNVSEKVQQVPGQPMLIDDGYFERIKRSLSETEYKRLYNYIIQIGLRKPNLPSVNHTTQKVSKLSLDTILQRRSMCEISWYNTYIDAIEGFFIP